MSSIAAVLFRRKALILIIFLSVLALSTLFTLSMPKKYEARMKVFMKHERAESIVTPDNSNAVVRGEVSEFDVNSEIELLTSAELLRQVVLRNHLQATGTAGTSQAEGEAVERAVRKLAKTLSITPVRKASIIHVAYSSEKPSQSAAVLNTLAELYLQNHLRVHRTPGTHDFYHAQAEQYQKQLLEAQTRLSDFRRRNDVVLLSQQKDLTLRRVMDTEQALNETTAGLEDAVGRITSLKHQLGSLQPRVVTQRRVLPNQYSVERLHTMLAELQNRRTALLAKFRPDDRLVGEVEDEIKETTAAMDRAGKLTSVEQTTDVNPLRQSLEGELARTELTHAGLESRRASLSGVLQSWRTRLARLDNGTAEHDALTRDIKQTEENLVLYSKKQEEARIADLLDQQKIANVSIAETPTTPYLPLKHNVSLNLALGFLLACFTSLGVTFALEMNRTTFDSPYELQAAMKLPVLASVPLEGI